MREWKENEFMVCDWGGGRGRCLDGENGFPHHTPEMPQDLEALGSPGGSE